MTVLQRYAAPIPSSEGVQFLFVASIALLAILVDFLAITEDMPGVAGLPLLAAFLTAAANGGSSLSPWYFVIAAAMWLVLVARQGRSRVQRWSTTVASLRTPVVQTDVESQVMWGYGNVARQLGLAAVVAAVVLPAIVPHLPTRYVLDGLGRSDGSIGREGRVGFNSTVDLTRSLQSGDDNIVMTYRTSAPTAPPLRVVVASTYVGGEWTPRPVSAPTQQLNQSRAISSQVAVTDRQLQVESNYLSPPHVASVGPVVGDRLRRHPVVCGPVDRRPLRAVATGLVRLTYREVDATSDQLQNGVAGAPSGRRPRGAGVDDGGRGDRRAARRRHRHGDRRHDVVLRRRGGDPEVAAQRRWLHLLAAAARRPSKNDNGQAERLTRSCGSSVQDRLLRPVRHRPW